MADLANTIGLAHDQGRLDEDDAYEGYVVPLAVILGNADRSGRMDPSVREALFDMDATDEPPYADTNGDFIQEDQLRDMRYRSMALLLNAATSRPRRPRTWPTPSSTTARWLQFYDYSGSPT